MSFAMSWLPDDVLEQLNALEKEYGEDSLARVKRMFADPSDRSYRHPLQKTSKYVLPGCSQEPWRELSGELGAAARRLETHHAAIRREFLDALARDERGLGTYTSDLDGSQPAVGWKTLYVYQYGKPVLENTKRFPQTFNAIKESMEPHLYALAEVHFSLLEPGTHIKPHSDPTNMTLSFHLGVDIPANCKLRVANDWYEWVEGKCFAFDHSFEHEAMNNSKVRRTALIMDVWNPEVTPIERKAVSLVFLALHEAFRGDA